MADFDGKEDLVLPMSKVLSCKPAIYLCLKFKHSIISYNIALVDKSQIKNRKEKN